MPLSILAFLLTPLSFFVFAFVLWRKLREDYPNDKIFLLTLGLIGSIVVGNWVFSRFPLFSFWASLALVVVIATYLVKKLEFRLFEVIDSVAPAWFWFLVLRGMGQALSTMDLQVFIDPGIGTIALLGYYAFQARYRTFSWYPSGKIGFAGFTSLALYFLSRSIFGVYTALTSSLSIGVFNGIIGLVLFSGAVTVIYFRGREQV